MTQGAGQRSSIRPSVHPTRAAGNDAAPLTDDQVAAWRARGAVVVDDLVPVDLVTAARAAAVAAAPPFDPAASGDFGTAGFVFPAECDAFNELTLHPRLIAGVAQLLGVDPFDLRLTQSDLWIKHGRVRATDDPLDNDDQRIHVDFPNHTLVHPPAWESPEAVEVIIYADRVDACDGATHVVLRDGPDDPAYVTPIVATPGVGAHGWLNARAAVEAYFTDAAPDIAAFRDALYAREQPVHYDVGTVLLYRHDTWHRGTPVRAGATRVAHNLTFRRADAEWISTLHPGWSWAMYRRSRVMERLVATATVEQRCVLGFPAPGHRYWTAATLAAVAARYGPLGFDPSPYLEALSFAPGGVTIPTA